MNKIVITGGPCAGKTSIIEILKMELADNILVVPEAATLLLSGGFPAPGKQLDYCDDWQLNFQRAVLSLQQALEGVYELLASRQGAELVICDGGMLSGAAYMPQGLKQFIDLYGVSQEEMLNNYQAVVHLETIALAYPDKYGLSNNEHRYTTLDQAIELDQLIKEVWQDHPGRYVIESGKNLEDKVMEVMGIIKNFLQKK